MRRSGYAMQRSAPEKVSTTKARVQLSRELSKDIVDRPRNMRCSTHKCSRGFYESALPISSLKLHEGMHDMLRLDPARIRSSFSVPRMGSSGTNKH